MIAQRLLASFTIAAITLGTIPCMAWQSGSRSSVPSGSGSRGAAQAFSNPVQSAPIQSAPIQQFSNPQSFATPQSFSTPQNFSAPSINLQDSGFSQNQVPGIDGLQYQNVQPQVQSQAMNSVMSEPMQMQPSSSGSAAPGIPESSLVDPIFQISDPNSLYAVDHSAWDAFLAQYLVTDSVGLNRIRYRQINCQDRAALQGYLNMLQSTDIRTLNRNEQLAFWFNLYNARTVALAFDNYPIRSIRQIKQKFTDFVGPFDDEGAVNVLGKSLSLNDIESGIIRPGWSDPRIHYALNCASYGCPNLAPTAWTGNDIDSRLNSAAYQFINSDRAVKGGPFGPRVSKIYKWYGDDFGGNDQSILKHISQYANCETLKKINGRQNIRGYFYDWSLSDARVTRRRLFESIRR